MAQPILHHRTEEFGRLFEFVLGEMQYVCATKNTMLMMTCSGTGAMESAVANLLSPGDEALVHATGAFGERFALLLKAYGLSPIVISEDWGHEVDSNKLEQALKKNPGVKAVFLQHTDTSTGILNDIERLARIVRENSEALVVVDAISSLAAEVLKTDAWGLDVVLAASQKGLMSPPGLAFACVSQRAWRLVEKARLPRFYFDWRTMRKSLADRETPYTPAVTLVAAQAEALKLIRAEGIENVCRRTETLSAYARQEAGKLGLKLLASKPAHILTALWLPAAVDGNALIAQILKEEGISIAGGQLHLKGKIVRVAHMGFISREDVEAGFAALARRLRPVQV
jgi:aspartate aminotransferase-like enzyme